MTKKFSALISIGAEVGASVKAAFGGLESSMKRLNQQLSATAKNQSGIKKLSSSIAGLGQQEAKLKQAMHGLAGIRKEMQAAGTPSAALTAKFEKQKLVVDKLRGSIGKQRTEVERLSGDLRKAGINTSNLTGEFARLERRAASMKLMMSGLATIQNAGVGPAFARMTGQLRSLTMQMTLVTAAAAGLGFGMFSLAKSTSDYGDKVAKTADSLGIGLRELQQWRYMAERSGLSVEEADSGLQRFVVNLGKAKTGSGEAANILGELGLSADRLSQLTPDRALATLADRLKDVENQSDKARIATALFGRTAGTKMLNVLAEGSDGMRQLAKDAELVGYVLGEQAVRDAEVFNDTLLDFNATFRGLKNMFGAVLMPVFTDGMKEFSAWVRENSDKVREWAARFGELAREFGAWAAKAVPKAIPKIVEFAKQVGDAITKVADFVGGWKNLALIIVGLKLTPLILSILQLGFSLGKAAFGVGKFIAGLVGMAGTAGGLGAKIAGIIAMIPGWGWIIAAVVAVVAGAAVLIWKNWDRLVTWWQGVWPRIEPAWNRLKEAAGNLASAVMQAIQPLVDWLGEKFAWLGAWLGEHLPGFIEMALNNAATVVEAITGYITTVLERIEAVKQFISGAADFIRQKIEDLLGVFKSVFSWSPMGAVKAAWTPALNWIKSKVDWVADAGRKVGSFFGGGKEEAGAREDIRGDAFDRDPQFPIRGNTSQNTINNTDNRKVSMTVHAAPGMSEKAVADAVVRKLNSPSPSSGALFDDNLVPA